MSKTGKLVNAKSATKDTEYVTEVTNLGAIDKHKTTTRAVSTVEVK